MAVRRRRLGPIATRDGALAALFGLSALLTGCRGDPDPFQLPDPPAAPTGPFQLTLSPFHDAGPVWTPDGTEIAYAAGQTYLFPEASSAVVAVPATGGQARALAESYQDNLTFPNLVAPALSPDGRRLAVVELRFTLPLFCAPGQALNCGELAPPSIPGPELELIAIAVRDVEGAATGPEQTASFDVRKRDEAGLLLEADPFQRYYSLGGLPFRPTWSPDGRRVAYSDGVSLKIWDVEAGTVTEVPNTAYAVSPAWSPDGATIAFVQMEAADPESFTCTCSGGGAGAETATRLVRQISTQRVSFFDVATGTISILPLTSRDPAWSPDGRWVFFERFGELWRMPPLDPTLAAPIPATEGGRHPAVSPDGTHLAFTRTRVQDGVGDIWILPLPDALPPDALP
ncbi:MAG: hypothetical protein ABFS34_15430 [Gemmatimonadota bacterium]